MPHPVITVGRVPTLARTIIGRLGVILISVTTVYLIILVTFSTLNPNKTDLSKIVESERWVATSHSWLDRISCRRIGICGGSNWLLSTWLFAKKRKSLPDVHQHKHSEDWVDHRVKLDTWTPDEIRFRHIPDYVFQHAPLLYLHEDEQWWPTDVADFLHHVEHVCPGSSRRRRITLSNMDETFQRENEPDQTFLQSLDDPESLPGWLTSSFNKPLESDTNEMRGTFQRDRLPFGEQSKSASSLGHDFRSSENIILALHSNLTGGEDCEGHIHCESWEREPDFVPSKQMGNRSQAPAFLITVRKENNTIDAFWFFFYAFNRGARVTGIQYGNHVGDWEHILIRFRDGRPTNAFLSAHEWGSAYDFQVLEKLESNHDRPVIYAGLGSHAHYATPGDHAYALPFGLLGDRCSQGYLWDPNQNLISYVYQPVSSMTDKKGQFLASTKNPRVHTSWLDYRGHWGDRRYSLGDPLRRNYRFAGEYKYLNGPTGPWDKALDRDEVCEHASKPCIIRDSREGYVGPIKGTAEIESFGS